MILLPAILAFSPEVSPAPVDNCVFCSFGDTLTAIAADTGCWYIAIPVREAYGNMIPGGEPEGLGTDTLSYRVEKLAEGQREIRLVSGGSGIPADGVFYLVHDPPEELTADTLRSPEPLHLIYGESVIQVAARDADDFTGYLFEMIGAPFLMTPRLTPAGFHQGDTRMGCDCAGLAVYGARRVGLTVPYAGPMGIVPYLCRVEDSEFTPDTSGSPAVYRNPEGMTRCPERGEILHFGTQVSVFLEDRGIEGVMDSEDLLIQSWFSGPHVCTLEENGFYPLPARIFRWPGL